MPFSLRYALAAASVAAAVSAKADLSLEFSAPYLKGKVSLSNKEASTRFAIGGNYGLYGGGIISSVTTADSSSVGADIIAATLDVPGIIPLSPPRLQVVTAHAEANWSLEILNGSFEEIISADAYVSAIGQLPLSLLEFSDKNGNNIVDQDEIVSTYDLQRLFGILQCNSDPDVFWCNATSLDGHFNMLSAVSQSTPGRTQYGDILTSRHVQTVYTIVDFPFKGTGTKLALRSFVASACGEASITESLSLKTDGWLGAMDEDPQTEVFYGWGGKAKTYASSSGKEGSAGVKGSFWADAEGVVNWPDNATVTAYLQAFGMAKAKVSYGLVDLVIDLPSWNTVNAEAPQVVRISSGVGSGPLPEADGTLSTGAVVGISIGAIAGVGLIVGISAFAVIRSRRRRYQTLE